MTKSLSLILSCVHLSESTRAEAPMAGSQMIQLKASTDDAADSQATCEVCLQKANERLGASCVLAKDPHRCFVWAMVKHKCGLNSECLVKNSLQPSCCFAQFWIC